MTKRHFDLIARVLRDNLNGPDCPVPVRDNLINAFARELRSENGRFDTGRFDDACRGEDSTDSAGRKVRYSQV